VDDLPNPQVFLLGEFNRTDRGSDTIGRFNAEQDDPALTVRLSGAAPKRFRRFTNMAAA
jgi:hypothetical protein